MIKIDFNQVDPLPNVGDVFSMERDDSKYIAILKCIGTMFNQATYIYNFEKKEIIHFEGNNTFFNYDCEKDSKQYAFYEKRVHADDLSFLAQTNRAAFNFLQVLPHERKWHACITSNFRMKGRNCCKLVNHKLAPLEISPEGQLRTALCVITPSVEESSGNVYVRMGDTAQVFEYIPQCNKFIETKNQRLSSRGFMILELAAIGKTEAEIAEILKIAKTTVKYHKKEIFCNLGVSNISAAIQWYNNNK